MERMRNECLVHLWHVMSMLPDEVAVGRAELAAFGGEHGRPVPGTSLFMKINMTARPSPYDEFPAGRRREGLPGTPEQAPSSCAPERRSASSS